MVVFDCELLLKHNTFCFITDCIRDSNISIYCIDNLSHQSSNTSWCNGWNTVLCRSSMGQTTVYEGIPYIHAHLRLMSLHCVLLLIFCSV